MNPAASTYPETLSPAATGSEALSIALIGPDVARRKEAASALLLCDGVEVREYADYPASLGDVPRLLDQQSGVIIIDLDSKPEYALELVEHICSLSSSTVMVYSSKPDPDLLVRCMRAGAREFLTPPFVHSTMKEALHRASGRRSATRMQRKTGGRLLVFLGAKGGAGVTTLACNFAVALAQESGQSTLLIDLDLPLGDAALNLGIVTEYSTVNALQDAGRLDASFLNKLLTKHSSGVSVLAAPGKFPQFHASNESIDKLMTVARQEFDNVVVDVGARLDLTDSALFRDAFTIYLVTQAGIPELRNSNRLIGQFFTAGSSPKLEIVVNRYEPRSLGVSDDAITKALTRPPTWKIPNDYASVRQMQNTATPLAMGDSPISKLIREMAISICGQRATQPKKKGFRLFG
ncbi:MAG: AAA family ATPase [Terracidiphilus sp.]